MKNSILQLLTNADTTILSSKSLFYKTEKFIEKTKSCSNIDILLTTLCETILDNLNDIIFGEKEYKDLNNAFFIQTADKKYTFLFKLGYQVSNTLNKHNIIFFDYQPSSSDNQTLRIDEYVRANPVLKLIIKKEVSKTSDYDFNKLYLISNISGINLPRLSPEQKEIVETIDKNILVQGVAGSGKTNICIDKIIFTASKNYSGKTLYTTYSHGLLIDTKLKVELYKKDLEKILDNYRNNKIKFLDSNHKKALENRLGIYFFNEDDNNIFKKVEKIIDYLTNKVDYLMLEDIYNQCSEQKLEFVGEEYFLNTYSKNLTNHQIQKCFNKLSTYSKEVIFKEIYGMLLGFYNIETKSNMLTLEEYISKRENSIPKDMCESIYQIAVDYKKHCEKLNLMDNNSASNELLTTLPNDYLYSLAIIDEVQDYTQVNLNLFKKISLKLFCVGDALQMINPSYFNFGYLKNLMYEKELVDVKVLKSNYRSTEKITDIIDSLGEINKSEFGTHNFVIKGEAVESGIKTTALFVRDGNFTKSISTSGFEDLTFVVNSKAEKQELQKIIKQQEVLTISEIKGLERNNIVTYNLLSSNIDKWRNLKQHKVNHKQADENSIYRYYYNLFYVGLSRAKQNLIVFENNVVDQFENFLKDNFEKKELKDTIRTLEGIISKAEFSQLQLMSRVKEFIKLEQYDNARFAANKIKDDASRLSALRTIEIAEKYIRTSQHREAGIKFWEYGMLKEAKEQFTLSKDTILNELIDMCASNSSNDLNIDIVNYFDLVKDNAIAQAFIVETVKKDVSNLKNSFNKIKENFKKGRK